MKFVVSILLVAAIVSPATPQEAPSQVTSVRGPATWHFLQVGPHVLTLVGSGHVFAVSLVVGASDGLLRTLPQPSNANSTK